MDRKKCKENKSRVLLMIVAICLLLAVTISLAACSLFTDAVTDLFKGDSQKVEQNAGTGEGEHGSGEQGGSGESGSGGSGESGESGGSGESGTSGESGSGESGSGEHGGSGESGSGESGSGESGSGESGSGGSGSSGTEVTPTVQGCVTITSSLEYDKASRTDLTLSATHDQKWYYTVMGMGLVSDGSAATVRTLSTPKGSSSIQIDGEYLSALDVGVYDFYYVVYDNQAKKYYEPFALTIKNTNASPTNVKINYDVDAPNVYVTFHCDCGGSHTVTFDGVNSLVAAGQDCKLIDGSVNKHNSHTAVVTCVGGAHSSVTKAGISSTYDSYLTNSYSFMGHTADLYIEDISEAIDLCQYLAYQGENVNKKVYVKSTEYTAFSANPSAYLGRIQDELVIPWSMKLGCEYLDPYITFKMLDVNASGVISTGYEGTDLHNDNPAICHSQAINARTPGSALPIDQKQAVSARNVKEMLAVVEAGLRPVVTGSALTQYNVAKEFCYTYLSDDMTDKEKLHVIYDFLASYVDYDNSALNLYNLIASLPGNDLATAKDMIADALNDGTNGFSASMRDAIEQIADGVNTTTDDLYSALRNNYLNRLAAFSIEGVFSDGTAVCEGISYAFMLLARIEGIECYQVTGYATNNGRVAHAWNKVKLNDEWYCVDATWGNYTLKQGTDSTKYVTHRYFLMDEASFAASHEEYAGNAASVKNLALGDAEYYKSVETEEGHSLYISDYSDLVAAVRYYDQVNNSLYMEFMIDPSYDVLSGAYPDLHKAFRAVDGRNATVQYSNGTVLIVYFIV